MRIKQFLLGAWIMLPLLSCGDKQQQQGVAQVGEFEVMTVVQGKANLQSVYPATIKGKEDIEIRPRIEGFIEAIYVDEGSVVKKGQSLFKINSPQSEQAVVTAQAAVNSAKVDVDRIRPLVEKGILSETRLQVVENAYQSALAVLRNAQEAARWMQVTSPVDGVVGTLTYRQGSLVDKNYVLTTVANINDVYAYFSLNEKELMEYLSSLEGTSQKEKIKNIPPVHLVLADGSKYTETGSIETISGVVNVGTGTANLRAKFPNKQGLLRSGTSGKVLISKPVENVFVIPQKATFTLQDKVLVFKVVEGVVEQTVVSVTALPEGKEYAVSAGLNEGDQIVTSGILKLKSGDKISIKQ